MAGEAVFSSLNIMWNALVSGLLQSPGCFIIHIMCIFYVTNIAKHQAAIRREELEACN